MPEYIGKVCVCRSGRVGLVVRRKEITFTDSRTVLCWEGIGLDGKGLWASTHDPVVLHQSIDEYMDVLAEYLKKPGCVYPPLGAGALNPIGT